MTAVQEKVSLEELSSLGQSIWYDYIRRSFITSGELQHIVDQGVRGVTSNPTIFEKAIAGSADYDDGLRPLVAEGKSVDEIYEALVLEDIAGAADILRPVYDATSGADGYVSLEVSPTLAHDTQGTIAEARRLHAALHRPNVMIKVPATSEGIPAIQALIGEGISVNATLIFSVEQYERVAVAYLTGLEKLAASGKDLASVASVASCFVSRVDTTVDRELEQIGNTELQGKIAIANTKLVYDRFHSIFRGPSWDALAAQGARVQRPLWASTGTKNPAYPDTLYVDSLIGSDTVNTVPPATLAAFLDHGQIAPTLQTEVAGALADLARLAEVGINLDAITDRLQVEAVASFAKSFETLMASIAEKRAHLLADHKTVVASLGPYQRAVDEGRADLKANKIMRRIWAHDYTVWKPDPTEITNRLGWLHSPETMREQVPAINALVDAVRAAGYTDALLLGMGGSSLAPEVFSRTFAGQPVSSSGQQVSSSGQPAHLGPEGPPWARRSGRVSGSGKAGFLNLTVLDSTDPEAVLAAAAGIDPARTLFIVSTKSGGTVETFSYFKYFYNLTLKAVGPERVGEHFIAITDPGSKLAETAETYRFRATFINDPNIGGRYSALTMFGLVPAALVGVDLPRLLDRAETMARNCDPSNCPLDGDNGGGWLGAVMGQLARAGRDKVTLIASPPIAAYGAWVEQLIAESTGKDGTGILPVAGEQLGSPDEYGMDRLFAYLRLQDDATHDAKVQALIDAGHPVVQINLQDLYDLGREFFRWEMATAVAGRFLGINPFDQPNVESAKVLARRMVAAYQEQGKLPPLNPTIRSNGITVYADVQAEAWTRLAGSPVGALQAFLQQSRAGDYVCLQAYVQPTGKTSAAIERLRTQIRTKLRVATTAGYGPRFLHSTGQLHKGDGGNGLFIQLTDDSEHDVPIPDEAGSSASSISFGVLIAAQSLGDRQALLDNHRRVIRFHLGKDVAGGLKQLTEALA